MSRQIAIVFHSGYGHTRRQAEAVQAGAGGVAGTEAGLYPVDRLDDAGWAQLDAAAALGRRVAETLLRLQ